jgi:hypothetical protein
MPSFSSDFRHPSTEHVGHAPGLQQYSPPGGTNFREEDYRTSEQRPLFKPELSMQRQRPNHGRHSERCLMPQWAVAEFLMPRNF